MYADPVNLGYDPTMKPAADNRLRSQNQWQIVVHHIDPQQHVEASQWKTMEKKPDVKTYKFVTTKVLSNVGAEGLRGRGTRVWSAQQIVNGQTLPTRYVIKDYWVDDDRFREATIRQKIISDAPNERKQEILKRHLLTPFCSGDVLVDGEVDNTHHLLRRGASVPTDLPPYPLFHERPLVISDDTILDHVPLAPKGSGIIISGAPAVPAVKIFHEKSHHRIVFIEQAETIDTLTSMGETLQRSAQALYGALISFPSAHLG
jgi:hypothetical protein